MKKPDFTKVRSLAIASFCIITAVCNIYTVTSERKADQILFYEQDSVIEDSLHTSLSERSGSISEDSDKDSEISSEDNFKTDFLSQKSNVSDQSSLVNLNTASSEELQSLTGIGPTKAAAIIDYRKCYGGFKTIQEIMEVKGIGEGTYSKIKDHITVDCN